MSNNNHIDGNKPLIEADFNKKYDLDKSFKSIKKLNDPRLGEVRLFQHPETKAVIAVREIKINEKKQAEIEILKCQKRMRIQNQYVLPLIEYAIEKQSSLCSSFYLLKLFYEYPPTDIRKELLDKKKEGSKFSTEELLHLLFQQIEAHKHLELTRGYHGDVRPIYWGLNSTLWHSKLICKPEDIDSSQKILQVQMHHLQMGDAVYQSPALYENLMSKNLKFNFTPNKEDMFATAMIILELGVQDSLQDVYGKNGKFDHEAMKRHVAKFEQIYNGPENQLLVTTVLTMLEPDESKRPHFILLHERMPSYYSVVKFFENLRENPLLNDERPLEAFIYIDPYIIEGFTLEPGITHVKVREGPYDEPKDLHLNPTYSDRHIGINKDHHDTNYIGNAKIVERIIRRFEERGDQMVEKVEHFLVKDNNILVKTEEYELIKNRRYNVKYFDEEGNEILENHDKKESKKNKEDVSDNENEGKSPRPSMTPKKDKTKKRSTNSSLNKSIEKHKNNKFNAFKTVEDDKDDHHD